MKALDLSKAVTAILMCVGLPMLGCSSTDGSTTLPATGGAVQGKTGGNTQGGQGGATAGNTGGKTVSPSTGGQPGSGGNSQGGVQAQGGSTGNRTGGNNPGGTSAAGGAGVTGGSMTGGTSSSGGQAASSGGAPATGGKPSTGGASNTGGNVGSGGAPAGGSASVPKSCVGWASVNAEGVNGTTGGGNGPVVEIKTGEELASYRRNLEPMTFRIMNDITGEIQLGSNKTVEGANKNVTIHGGLVFSGKGGFLSNLIIRNLRINAAKSTEDGIDIRQAHHVCIEHCEIFDGPDGNLDIVSAGNYITVAYTKFYYTANYKPLPGEPSPNHRYSNLVGNSDGATATDRDRLKVTYHHNWWGDLVVERMPRIRFGEVHVFNNYFSAKGNNYGIGAGFEAKVVVENNYFEDMKDPHIFYEGEKTAQIVAKGNEYVNVTGLKDSGQGDAFVPPYPYAPEPAATVKATVMAGAGPQ